MLLNREDIATVLRLITRDLEKDSDKITVSEFKHVGIAIKEVTITHEDFGTIVLTN